MKENAAVKEKPLTTAEKLDRLYGMILERDSSVSEIDIRIETLQKERREKTGVIDEEIALLEAEIKEECLGAEESTKGRFLQVVFTKGRKIFDSTGFKDSYPALYEKFTTLSKPSVSIRGVALKEKG